MILCVIFTAIFASAEREKRIYQKYRRSDQKPGKISSFKACGSGYMGSYSRGCIFHDRYFDRLAFLGQSGSGWSLRTRSSLSWSTVFSSSGLFGSGSVLMYSFKQFRFWNGSGAAHGSGSSEPGIRTDQSGPYTAAARMGGRYQKLHAGRQPGTAGFGAANELLLRGAAVGAVFIFLSAGLAMAVLKKRDVR